MLILPSAILAISNLLNVIVQSINSLIPVLIQYWGFITPFISIIGAFLLNRYYKLKKAKKEFIEVYKNSNQIKDSDFNIAKYNEYYYKRLVNTEISNSINNQKNILIIGKPKAGKTRAAYEAIKSVKGFKVIKFWEELIKIEELSDNLFKGNILIFIDDLNKYIGKLDLNRLIKKLNSKSKKYLIVATCRNGEEYKQSKKEFGEYFHDFKIINIEDINRDIAQNLSDELNLKVGDFDGTVGSLFLGIGDMKLRYEDFPKECRTLFTVIKLFANAESYIIIKKTLKKVYNEKLIKENMQADFLFEEVIHKLKENSFIFEESEKVSICHDTYLDIPKYEVSFDDLKWLKTVLFQIRDENALFNIGNSFNDSKNYEEAIQCYNKAIETNSKNDKSWNNKGIALAMLNKYTKAIKCYNNALNLNSNNDNAWTNKGISLAALDKIEESIECYDKALEINPKHEKAWNNKGNAFSNMERYEDAIKCYNKALEINPEYGNAWNSKGTVLAMLKKHIDAIKCYDKTLEINPNYEYAWYNKGDSLKDLGGYWDAIESYDKAIEINQKNTDSWYHKGIVFSKLEEYEECNECFDKVLEINPKHDGAWNNKGNALAMLGKYKKSIECYDKVLEINPNHKTAQNNKMLSISKFRIEK